MLLMLYFFQRLGENVGRLVLGGDGEQGDFLVLNVVSNDVPPHTDVFGSAVIYWVAGEQKSATVVLENLHWTSGLFPQFLE